MSFLKVLEGCCWRRRGVQYSGSIVKVGVSMKTKAAFLAVLCTLMLAAAPPVQEQDAPEFSVEDFLGNSKFSLADLRGRVVILEFWATW